MDSLFLRNLILDMNKLFSIISFVLIFVTSSYAFQYNKSQKPQINNKPKLVVGIVVDQMRFDYLTRFNSKFGEGGFKRLQNEGFNCKNNHFNYIPTYTGPGHASIYTGTTPNYHGIIANNWFDKFNSKKVYCASDNSVVSVGVENIIDGKRSPHRLLSTTFADENKLFHQGRSKSIGISIKDRGSILSIGHTADAAYWFFGKDEGKWITSSYFMDKLPDWVSEFNNSNKIESYLKEWDTFYPIEKYTESGKDLNNYENTFVSKQNAVFPYDLKKLAPLNGNFDILKNTPYGNSIVADFAIETIKNESLGEDEFTDVLTVSFSSTDYVGHKFGVNSKEIQDTYIRLDKELERFLNFLDSKVGIGNYTLFLTADHGAVDVPQYLRDNKVPAGYSQAKDLKSKLDLFLLKTFGVSTLIKNMSNNQIFINKSSALKEGIDYRNVIQAIVDELINYPSVYRVFSSNQLNEASYNYGVEALVQNGYNQKFSGDVVYVLNPATLSFGKKGSSHGSGFNYDTHVPLLFFGAGIKQGETYSKTVIPDIAPTISSLLGISFPNMATGRPLSEVLK